ncbi:uncharacterized protein LOC127289062 [Leptopilina boulardi]|uniref:uncharacterized protein LOC127289062 n=1 Tax=Leptopilina boulardi TaxID=63433 RepID=UPI0021F54747|nr:uncharacterized protein LOC127289062 [Leptopilina boulardi]
MELDNYFYRINQVLLSACGFWPQQSKREKTIRRFIFFIIDLSNFPPLIVYACYNWRDADALAVCFAFITSYSLGVTKISNNIIQDKKIQYLFKQIKYHWNVWSSEPQVKLIQQFANQARSYNFMYTVAVCASASSYTVITVVPEIYYLLAQCTNVTRDPSIFAEEFGIDSEKYFHWILAYSVISVWVNSIIYVTADIMYLTLVQHACGILCAVGNRFEDVNLLYRNQTAKNLNFLIFKDLLFCIQQHNIALKFANILNEVYSLYFLCTVGLNAASLVFVASQTVIHLDKFDNVVKFGNYGLLIICLLFLSSFPAQKLMDQSSTISQNIYNTYWYEMPISIKKSLFFVLVRTSNLCTIKIWKFYVLSLQTFASILQTTISVCMLLLSVR